MKKFLIATSALVMSAFVSFAYAEAVPISSGNTIGPEGDTEATETCVLLGERVSVSLSSDVIAAFECEEATSAIDIGTCHTAGQRAARTIQCENFAADGEPDNWNVEGCSDTVTEVQNAVGYTGYAASSTGGSVQLTPLAGNCEADTLGTISIFE